MICCRVVSTYLMFDRFVYLSLHTHIHTNINKSFDEFFYDIEVDYHQIDKNRIILYKILK